MISFLKKIITENWQRKTISLILAMITWLLVTHSMTTTKTIHGVTVKVANIPQGKTIEGVDQNGILNKKVALNISGNKNSLEELSGADLEVLLDASNKTADWIAVISPKNLRTTNPEIDLSSAVNKISHSELILKVSKLASEKIPIYLSQPTGDAPTGYQFLNIWPHQLYVSVSGPEGLIKDLKNRGLKLSFNLGDITENDISAKKGIVQNDEISFYLPDSWKKITVPELSSTPLLIDDPRAQNLHIDFVKKNLQPLNFSIPINIFFPLKHSLTLNPDTYSLATDELVQKQNGIKVLNLPLFAKGVSRLFLDIIKEKVQITLIAEPKSDKEFLNWSIEFIDPQELENLYVAKALSEHSSEKDTLDEESLRSSFRNYLKSFTLFLENEQKLSLKAELQANTISIKIDNISSNDKK